MLDNLSGSGLSEQEIVAKMQGARSVEDQTSEPIESTDEAVTSDIEEAETMEAEEAAEDVGFEPDEDQGDLFEDSELYTVKVDGKERDVTLEDLTENYQKGEDYTNKTMKLAEERKAIEAERASLAAEVEKERQTLKAVQDQLKSLVSENEKSVDWDELRETDPSEYLRQKELLEKRKDALSQAETQANQDREVRRQALINSESQKLLTVVGDEWQDPEVKKKDLEGMYDYVFSRGITQDEVSNIVDHRFWLMVRDAIKGQKMDQAKSVVKKQVKTAPKTVKSKQAVKRTNQESQDIRSRLQQSGGKNMDDVVALMKAKRNR